MVYYLQVGQQVLVENDELALLGRDEHLVERLPLLDHHDAGGGEPGLREGLLVQLPACTYATRVTLRHSICVTLHFGALARCD